MNKSSLLRTVGICVALAAAVCPAPALENVSPVLEDIVDNCDGSYTANFGYDNPNAVIVTIPVGSANYFAGGLGADMGQPVEFLPGRHAYVFSVVFTAIEITWHLHSHVSTAAQGSANNQCGTVAISPMLESVTDNCDGTYTASFGYSNPNDGQVTIAVGPRNSFSDTADRGQPAVFDAGRVYDAFTVLFDGGDLIWSLDNHYAAAHASLAGNQCGDNAVDPVLERVIDNCDGTSTAWFGYLNPNAVMVSVPIGPDNMLIGKDVQNQTTVFDTGRVVDAFSVTFEGGNLVWSLQGHTETAAASAAQNSCPGDTVQISPVLEEVVDSCNGLYYAHFGYYNPAAESMHIAIGDSNYFYAMDSQDQGQPVWFAPGRAYGVFVVAFDSGSIVWHLTGRTATASDGAAITQCADSTVQPVLERVINNCDSTFTAWFGYNNPNAVSVSVPIGDQNYFTGLAVQPQIAVFDPGRHTDVFSVDFSGSAIVWNLQGHTATASADAAQNQCPCEMPEFIREPASLTVSEGALAAFSFEASGYDLSYRWFRNDAPVAGATDTALVVGPAALFNNGDEYRAEVRNSCDRTVVSRKALLTVTPACGITAHPAGDTIESGERFVAAVGASCEGASYQWFADTAPIPGALDSILITGPLSLADDGAAYVCVVTGAGGSDTSAAAIVTVIEPTARSGVVTISGDLHRGNDSLVARDGVILAAFVVDLYPGRYGGESVYTERFSHVAVKQGRFTLTVGRQNAGGLQELVSRYRNLYADISIAYGSRLEPIGARVAFTAAPCAFSAGGRVLYGNVRPDSAGIAAPVGAFYVDRADSNATWKKAAAGWIKLD